MKAIPARVLDWIKDGETLDGIVVDSDGWKAGEVVALARENGYALNVSSKRFQLAPRPKPHTTGGVVIAQAVTEPLTLRPAQRDLIAEGKTSAIGRVRKAAERAENALQALADILDETRATEAARREIERLEQELRDAKAKLRGGTPAAKTDDGPNRDPKVVRAWAAEHGVDCPATGRVPRVVVDAYLEAVAS